MIGIDISLQQTEANVGSFKADILAKEEDTDKTIIIENQLERTDHNHLGKIITYASGLNAEIIIWIAKDLRDEHRQAIDWLNEHTDSKINIFAIQIEVWKIADSPPAVKFHVIAQPNDWAKAVKKTTTQNVLSETKLLYLEFWAKFIEYAQDNNSTIRLNHKAKSQYGHIIRIGSSNAHITLSVDVDSQPPRMACGIFINSQPLFNALHENKEKIKNELSEQLDWQPTIELKRSRIKLFRDGDLYNHEAWPQYHDWMLKQAVKFQKVFPKYIKQHSEH